MSSNARNLSRGGGHARGRGRIQRESWSALVFAGGLATTSSVMDWIYAHKRLKRRWARDGRVYELVRRRLDAIADRVGRSRGPGRPWLWKLRPGHAPPGAWDGWLNPETAEPWPERLTRRLPEINVK
jgi:hypothetical protein